MILVWVKVVWVDFYIENIFLVLEKFRLKTKPSQRLIRDSRFGISCDKCSTEFIKLDHKIRLKKIKKSTFMCVSLI